MLILDYPSDGESVYILPEANRAGAECEHIVFATLVGIPRSYGEAYDDAEGSFFVEGEPVLTTFSVRDIERALDE